MRSKISKQKRKIQEPERTTFAKKQFKKHNIEFVFNGSSFHIQHNSNTIIFYPFTGWHTGKSIQDGRGIKSLISKLEKK